MILILRRRVAAIAAVGIFAASSCAPADDEIANNAADPQIVATTSIWADIASRALCDYPVNSIIPIGSDPHSWEPSMASRSDIERASLIIANGLDLEHGLTDLLDLAATTTTRVRYMTDNVDLLPSGNSAEPNEEHSSTLDPHIWLDPQLVIEKVEDIRSAAIEAGLPSTQISSCTTDYVDDLETLDAYIETLIAPLAQDQRSIVTNHDALAYFAHRYNLTVVGSVIPSTTTLSEPNPADLADLASTIERLDIRVIFTDAESSDAESSALAERLNIEIVPLLTATLTSGAEYGKDYVTLMATMAERMSMGLAANGATP